MSNNKHHSCPALMSDGRIFTNYLSNRMYNDYIKFTNDIKVNTDYKAFLQNNATNIIADNQKFLEKHNKCHQDRQQSVRDGSGDIISSVNQPTNVVHPFDTTGELFQLSTEL